jgi:hypothetical protein
MRKKGLQDWFKTMQYEEKGLQDWFKIMQYEEKDCRIGSRSFSMRKKPAGLI